MSLSLLPPEPCVPTLCCCRGESGHRAVTVHTAPEPGDKLEHPGVGATSSPGWSNCTRTWQPHTVTPIPRPTPGCARGPGVPLPGIPQTPAASLGTGLREEEDALVGTEQQVLQSQGGKIPCFWPGGHCSRDRQGGQQLWLLARWGWDRWDKPVPGSAGAHAC